MPTTSTKKVLKREPIGKSIYLFDSQNKFRRTIFKLADHPRFDTFILIFIVISSALLSLENPLNDPNS